MRGQRVYGREFLRIPVPDTNAGSGNDTITIRQQRTRQDNSKIDPDIGDSSKSYILSTLANKTSSHEEQKSSSLFRSSSFSRSLRRPWYKDSPLPVSSHTSQEAVRRRLPVKNQTLNINNVYLKGNHSLGSGLLKQNLQNNSKSSPGILFLQPLKLDLNSSTIKSSHNFSLINNETNFSVKIGSIPSQRKGKFISSDADSSQRIMPTRLFSQRRTALPFSKNVPSQKLHVDSSTSRVRQQNTQKTNTTIRKLFGDTTTFSPLTTETLIKEEPKSTTEFTLYPVSDYEDYYYSLDDETQLISTTNEIAVTDPYIGQESVTDLITEASHLNFRKTNGSEYKKHSSEHIITPVSFITSTTEKNTQIYNNTIKFIPRNYYRNSSPSSTTAKISTTLTTVPSPSTSTTPVMKIVQTRRPTRRYKYTTPSLALRQRLLANRFRIRQFSSERRGRVNKLSSNDSNLVITSTLNSIVNNKLNISTTTSTTKLPNSKSQNDYLKSQKQTSLPSLQIEKPFEVSTPIETNIPHPSPLHLLTDSLIVEVNRGPIMKNQGYSRDSHDSLKMAEQSIKENQEIKDIQQLSLLDNNDTFIILPAITEMPITTLKGSDFTNTTNFNQYDTISTQKNIDTTITNTELSTEELDMDISLPVTNAYEVLNLTTSSTFLNTTIPSTTQSSIKMKTKEETKASWEAQSRSLSTSAVRTEVRTTEHEIHVKIYEKLPTPAANTELNKMIESLERLKKQQGTSPLGSSPFGANPGGTSAFGLVPQGHYPQGRNPFGSAALQQAPTLTESTTFPTTVTSSTSSSPSVTASSSQTEKTKPEPNMSKFQLERKTEDGFIIGEYGVVDHDKGNVNNGVRYTADGNVDPKLIHDALQIFLSL